MGRHRHFVRCIVRDVHIILRVDIFPMSTAGFRGSGYCHSTLIIDPIQSHIMLRWLCLHISICFYRTIHCIWPNVELLISIANRAMQAIQPWSLGIPSAEELFRLPRVNQFKVESIWLACRRYHALQCDKMSPIIIPSSNTRNPHFSLSKNGCQWYFSWAVSLVYVAYLHRTFHSTLKSGMDIRSLDLVVISMDVARIHGVDESVFEGRDWFQL